MNPGRPWIEVRVAVPRGWEELVAGEIGEAPGHGCIVGPVEGDAEPAPDGCTWVRTYLDPKHDERDQERLDERVTSLGRRAGVPELEGLRLAAHALPTEEWIDFWRRYWKPFRVGRIAIVTPETPAPLAAPERTPARRSEIRLRLEPGRAFGTGRHPTTRTCLLELQKRLVPGQRVLDAGAGSGILSVAAALLGARECLGFDVDAHARTVFEPLALDNRVSAICRFRHGGFDCVADEAPFDVVLANLYSDVLLAHAGDLAKLVNRSGWIAASGCPVAHREPVRRAFLDAGLDLETEIVRGRWCTLLLRPRDGAASD